MSLKHQVDENKVIMEEDEDNFRPTILTISGSRQTNFSRNNTEVRRGPDISVGEIDLSIEGSKITDYSNKNL